MAIVNKNKRFKDCPVLGKPSLSDYDYGNCILVGYFKNKPDSLTGGKIIQENIKDENGTEISCYVQVLVILKSSESIQSFLQNNKDELLKDGLVKVEVFKKDKVDLFPSLF